ncbi:MAG: coproporphyrinogen dehydrogenase HemZ [Clostridia bacterium]|nr:coproporphyrinogen dehydrogenase HemZ [Clostridia bacterium]
MYKFKTNKTSMELDFLDIVKLFFKNWEEIECGVNIITIDNELRVNISYYDSNYIFNNEWNLASSDERMIKRFAKLCLYRVLSKETSIDLPWGSVTGVRPTKLAYEYLSNDGSVDSIADYLSRVYLVSNEKAKLVEKIISIQKPYLYNDDFVNIYVNIPVCQTRCNYCSFSSDTLKRLSPFMDEYVSKLCIEIEQTKMLINSQGKKILSIYFGGGTPSILSPSAIASVLRATGTSLETTFEAGREDSITLEKLKAMKDCGVHRICLNPQSLNDKTMIAIGRNQTEKSFYKCYESAEKFGFIINTDIIAGLDGENFEDFKYTADRILQLKPQNVTVHTLSRKRGSDNAEKQLENVYASKMIDYSANLFSKDYNPYYMYRQKYMLGGLENTGYALSGTECINNITVMEETVPVYACGAGGISKRFRYGNIDRYANIKDIPLYLEKFDERLDKKIRFLSGEDV